MKTNEKSSNNTDFDITTPNSACSDDSVIYELLRKRLKEMRLKRNLTFEELEKLTGIKKSSLQRYESGNTEKVPFDAVMKLERALGANGYLTGWGSDMPKGAASLVSFKLPVAKKTIGTRPVFSDKAASLHSDKDYSAYANYCIYMPDDSMSDLHINSGDIVFVKEQDYLESGDIGVFSHNGEINVRYYYSNPRGCTLCSTHRLCPPISVPSLKDAGIIILGKAIAFQSAL